jgi:hypothetical protein
MWQAAHWLRIATIAGCKMRQNRKLQRKMRFMVQQKVVASCNINVDICNTVDRGDVSKCNA